MQLFIKGVNGRTHRLEVGRHTTIDTVKGLLQARVEGATAPTEQRLVYAGKELLDRKSLVRLCLEKSFDEMTCMSFICAMGSLDRDCARMRVRPAHTWKGVPISAITLANRTIGFITSNQHTTSVVGSYGASHLLVNGVLRWFRQR
jgi:hypothetical protein